MASLILAVIGFVIGAALALSQRWTFWSGYTMGLGELLTAFICAVSGAAAGALAGWIFFVSRKEQAGDLQPETRAANKVVLAVVIAGIVLIAVCFLSSC